MTIFQKSVIKRHLDNIDKKQVEKSYQEFRENYSPAKIEEIKKLKEEEYQDGFLRDIFIDIFGYILKPDSNYNLAREFKNQGDGKKADGAILRNEKAVAVIELKSTKTKDLKSITEQAFNYKNNQPECKYVITSNFQKLRFYIDYAHEYEEFDLFNLQKEDFELLYLLLNANSVFSDLPLKLKEETKFHEQQVSDKLYKDYSVFKSKLFENLIKNNPDNDKLTLFNKSQKLLDRFLFILFAEDSGLLPPNSISRIIDTFHKLTELDAYKPIYDIYKQYFGYMNIGRKGKTNADNIPAYNGGLFYIDELLDNLKIDDSILIDDLLKLSEYDFNTEVDVNILGHIFEHSLSEIEEITAEIEGTAPDKTKSKRKKDGVFYTPKYITQYIVENTIGTLCDEKRKELEIEEIEFDGSYRAKDGNLLAKGKKLFKKLNDYKDWLLSLKIVDPACGSGAFLNQALNFLITEHKNIDDIIADLTSTALRLFDTDKAILENNLYGVDINEESVEIAKLSLWLRTAQKGRKLSNLNNNIKCGNSLIDDPEIAGDKAFDWNMEFKEIMDNGGFDVVIGNPPYVQIRSQKILSNSLEKLNFETYEKMGDLYCLFYEQGVRILTKKGFLGYITSSTWMRANYGTSLRHYLSHYTNPLKLINLGSGVFNSATVDSNILILQKESVEIFNLQSIDLLNESKLNGFDEHLNSSAVIYKLNQEPWIISNPTEQAIRNKCEIIGIPLENWEINLYRGIQTGNNDVFLINESIKNYLISEDSNAESIIYPIIQGKNLTRYNVDFNHQYLIYTTADTTLDNYPSIKKYLLNHKTQLDSKLEVKQGKMVWYSLYRSAKNHFSEFFKDKIIFSKASKEQSFYLDNKIKAVTLNTSYIATGEDIKYLVAVLNSKFIRYCFLNFYQSGGINGEITMQAIEKIPIPKPSASIKLVFEDSALSITAKHEKLKYLINKFLKYLLSHFSIEIPSKSLQSWHKLEFREFIKELNKAINKAGGQKLSKIDEMEWMEVFEDKKTEVQSLKTEIDKTDKEIDKMVYELYELTDEEVEIVEEA